MMYSLFFANKFGPVPNHWQRLYYPKECAVLEIGLYVVVGGWGVRTSQRLCLVAVSSVVSSECRAIFGKSSDAAALFSAFPPISQPRHKLYCRRLRHHPPPLVMTDQDPDPATPRHIKNAQWIEMCATSLQSLRFLAIKLINFELSLRKIRLPRQQKYCYSNTRLVWPTCAALITAFDVAYCKFVVISLPLTIIKELNFNKDRLKNKICIIQET